MMMIMKFHINVNIFNIDNVIQFPARLTQALGLIRRCIHTVLYGSMDTLHACIHICVLLDLIGIHLLCMICVYTLHTVRQRLACALSLVYVVLP